VAAAMQPWFAENLGTPASQHQSGLRARDALGRARAGLAALINAASPDEIVFTSGGTEAANLAVKGVAYANQHRGNHIVLSAIEHPSVLNSVAFLEQQGFTSTRVGVDGEGRIDPDAVRAAITGRTILICVHHVNHDIGTIEPVQEIGAIAAEREITLFVDAVASGGWLPIDVQAMNAQLLSLSPHRFYGPKGVGVLYRSRRARLKSILHGGSQEGGFRAGTENVPAIVGAGVAADLARSELVQRARHTALLQNSLWNGLKAGVEYLRLNGPEPGPKRLTTNLNVSPEFVEAEGLALALDMQGIAINAGPGCLSKSFKLSPVLSAIGLDPSLARSSVILSLAAEVSKDDIDYAAGSFA
jgi:cysteine desulfurase